MASIWEMALAGPVQTGACIAERYQVETVDPRGFTMRRASGRTVRVTRRMVEDTAARLLAGERLKRHANRGDGGITYTTAIEAGVIAALAGLARAGADGRWELDHERARAIGAA